MDGYGSCICTPMNTRTLLSDIHSPVIPIIVAYSLELPDGRLISIFASHKYAFVRPPCVSQGIIQYVP